MNEVSYVNPAELAAKEALDRVFTCITQRRSFILEAGAGAGKTYSLIHALKYLVKKEGLELLRRNQKIACITYTNVAREEIESRTDRHPVIFSATIHAFCWSLIKDFQPRLREILPQIGKWAKRLESTGEINNQVIKYELGYPKVEEKQILISHNDVLSLTSHLMEDNKFRKIFIHRFPVLFIDEYQDTEVSFIESLKKYFFNENDSPLIGLFGDHWQKIYKTGCGKIEHPSLEIIDKRANFRSNKKIVDCLNRIRPELPQEVNDPSIDGSVLVYHTNEWQGERRSEPHWKDDLPSNVAHQYLEKAIAELTKTGWDFSPYKTKILMLTHNVLAQEQGYRNLADVFSHSESYIKKEDEYISFFANFLEPACVAYENRNFGQMFSILEENTPIIRSHEDKIKWATHMDTLLSLRNDGNVGMIVDHLRKTKCPRLPNNIEQKEINFDFLKSVDEPSEEEKSFLGRINKLRDVPYREVIALINFIEEKTPFATKHGVKGAEFDNVLVVLGGGWNMYNFSQMLEYELNGIPSGKLEAFQRNRNLFYVACSRSKKRLALLFTKKLSTDAIKTLSNWFGNDSVHSLII